MVSERFDLFAEPVDIQGFDGAHYARMVEPSPPPKQAPVGHLVGERVLERQL